MGRPSRSCSARRARAAPRAPRPASPRRWTRPRREHSLRPPPAWTTSRSAARRGPGRARSAELLPIEPCACERHQRRGAEAEADLASSARRRRGAARLPRSSTHQRARASRSSWARRYLRARQLRRADPRALRRRIDHHRRPGGPRRRDDLDRARDALGRDDLGLGGLVRRNDRGDLCDVLERRARNGRLRESARGRIPLRCGGLHRRAICRGADVRSRRRARAGDESFLAQWAVGDQRSERVTHALHGRVAILRLELQRALDGRGRPAPAPTGRARGSAEVARCRGE